MDLRRYLGMKKFIVLLILLFSVIILSVSHARVIVKDVIVKDTEPSTLSALDRFLEIAKDSINQNSTRMLCWYIDGNSTTGTSQGRTYSNFPFDLLPRNIRMHVDTAPTGASLIIDINDDGTSIFSTRPEIDANLTEEDGNEVFVQAKIKAKSDITLDIDQIGSSVAGADLTVCFYGQT